MEGSTATKSDAKKKADQGWLEKAAAKASRGMPSISLESKEVNSIRMRGLNLTEVLTHNGVPQLAKQEEILCTPSPVARATVAVITTEPSIVKRLRVDPNPMVKLALLRNNQIITLDDITVAGSDGIRLNQAEVVEAAKEEIRKRFSPNKPQDVKKAED
ncbi:MAG: hypothetical protein KGH94_03790 [Candidatus Micrarchaeota archaeon]|nr:hypothetical protein [Candidatus Micrarchaeota archaeon]